MSQENNTEYDGVETITIVGEPGDTPTKEELVTLIKPLIPAPIEGKAGKEGKIGERGLDGKDGKNGLDGKNGPQGVAGKDGRNGIDGKDGSPDTPDEVVDKVNTSKKQIKAGKVQGLSEFLRLSNERDSNPTGATFGGKTVRYLAAGTEVSAHVTELNFGTGITPTYDGEGRISLSVDVDEIEAWGEITGTLSDQTDLQNALDAKLAIAANLSDLANVATARGNLGVAISGVGSTTGGDITDDGDLTITVSAGTGLIRSSDDDTLETIPISWSAESGANVNLAADDISYIYVEYNGGSPRVIATPTERTDHHTNIFLGTVYSDGVLHITSNTRKALPNYISHTIDRLAALEPFARESGGVISETGTRNIAITAGAWWEGINDFTTPAVDTSGAGTFTYYYQDGIGGFTEVASQTQIDNTYYDDTSGTLAALTSNRYGVHWVYIEQDGNLAVVYGLGDYVIGGSQDAQPPASLPILFGGNHARLVGKIIIRQGTAVFTSIESSFDIEFTPALVTNHGDLAGLGDDDHPQYPLVDQAVLWALAY